MVGASSNADGMNALSPTDSANDITNNTASAHISITERLIRYRVGKHPDVWCAHTELMANQ